MCTVTPSNNHPETCQLTRLICRVYSLIVTALERHFTPSVQHPTLLPKVKISGHVDSGLAKALPLLAESGIITQAVTLVPWRDLPTPLVQDRSAFLGITINPEEIAASTGNALSSFASHLVCLLAFVHYLLLLKPS